MVDLQLLESYVVKSGLKKAYIAQELGVTREMLWRYLSGKSKLTTGVSSQLSKILGIETAKEREAVFFAENVALKATKSGKECA